MRHLDRGIVYIPINQNTTEEEMDKLKAPYIKEGRTVVFLRSGKRNIKTTISNLLNASL